MTNTYRDIQDRIDNTLELTSICRSEWCRELESEVDRLEDELLTTCNVTGSCSSGEVTKLKEHLNRALSNLSPNIRL